MRNIKRTINKSSRLLVAFFLLSGLCQKAVTQEVTILPKVGHSEYINSVAFSPDGKLVLSGGNIRDNTIILWEIATGREIRRFSGHTSGVTSVSFSPNGKQILSGSWDNTVKLWDTMTGREIKTFSDHTDSVMSVAFSHDGKQILSGSWDNTVKLWDMANGRLIRTFTGHKDQVHSVVFSPDDKYVFSGSKDGTAKLWDIATGKEIRTFSGHTMVYAVNFSPDGRQVLSGGYDTIKLWDTNTGREIITFKGKVSWFSSIRFSPDGKQIVFYDYSSDYDIKLLDVATGREIRTFQGRYDDSWGIPTNFSPDVCFSPDGKQILSGFDYIILWDIATGSEVKRFSGGRIAEPGNISFSPDGKQILSGVNPFSLWDAVNGREIRKFSSSDSSYGKVIYSPKGDQILSVDRNTFKIWNAANGLEIKSLSVSDEYSISAVFSPDGKQILSGSRDGIKIWDIERGRQIRNFPRNDAEICLALVSFSPDGRQALWGNGFDYLDLLELWDITTNQKIITFLGDGEEFVSALFSPDGKQVFTGCGINRATGLGNPNAKLWDAITGKIIREFPSKNTYAYAFSPDGKQILTSSGSVIELWETASARLIRTFSRHKEVIYSATFSPDGRQILSSSDDGTIRLWDISTGKEIAQFISFTDGEWLVLSPDGYYKASPNGDKYLNLRVGNNDYGIDQYRNTFYRPQIVEARLQGRPDPVRIDKTLQDVANFEPPVVVIRSPENGTGLSSNQVELSVSVVDQKQPVRTIKVLVNGRLVGGETMRGRISSVRGELELENTQIRLNGNQNRVEFKLPITLDSGVNRIEVLANNPYSEGRDSVEVNYNQTAVQQNILPNLWILSIGINRYDSPLLQNLDYAVNDAREIVNVFKTQEGKIYRKVNSLLITDSTAVLPTRENILDNFSFFLKQAGQRDVVMLFIAGHGQNDENGNFYFMPSDAAFTDDGSIRPSRAISYRDIQSVLDVPGQKLVFIDVCHSEGVSGRKTRGMDNNQLVRALQDNSTVIFTASRGSERSQESKGLNHGVFTYAIIQGMKGEADLFKRGQITMKELDTYVSEMVPKLTNGAQHPTTNTPAGYINFVVADLK